MLVSATIAATIVLSGCTVDADDLVDDDYGSSNESGSYDFCAWADYNTNTVKKTCTTNPSTYQNNYNASCSGISVSYDTCRDAGDAAGTGVWASAPKSAVLLENVEELVSETVNSIQ